MALAKVGDGHPYATISGAIAAEATGINVLVDAKAATGNQYAEAVSIITRVHLVGALPNQGISITGAGGGAAPAVLSSGAGGLILENLHISNVGSTATFVAEMNTIEDWIYRCFVDGGGTKEVLQSQWVEDTYVYNGTHGIQPSCFGRTYHKNITCVNMSVQGISSNAGPSGDTKGSLTYNCNGVGYLNQDALLCSWNFDDDGTRPGVGGKSFMTLGQISFVNYGAGDLRLNPDSQAYIPGIATLPGDSRDFQRLRETAFAPRYYGGAFDPTPDSPAFVTGVSGVRAL